MSDLAGDEVLIELGRTIDARRGADPASSWTARLLSAGEDTILKKVGEENLEFILAAKSGDTAHLVAEAADVWYHMLVLLSHKGLSPADVLAELQRRAGTSGIAEKAARGTAPNT